MGTLSISPIPCLRDNYAYAVVDGDEAWVVDPSEAEPVRAFLDRQRLALRGILATHHHLDHVGGIAGLVAMNEARRHPPPWVAVHAHDLARIPGATVSVDAGTERFESTSLVVAGRRVDARRIPGHTLGAVAWLIRDDARAHVFTGDTLFAAGCGRLFEGTPAQMQQSLRAITSLADDTWLWFGHEYTAANLRFAQQIEPGNASIRKRLATLASTTTPTTVALERETNPFVRARDVEHLATLRRAKDQFRG